MEMAPSIMSEQPTETLRTIDPSLSLRNPLPLSASQEAQVRDIYYKKVRTLCADEIREFAACARGRTFSLSYACKAQQLAMNSCMIGFSGPETEDAAREEWFAGVRERRKKKEEELAAVEVRRKEVIDMTKRQEVKEKAEEEAKKREKASMAAATGKSKTGWWR